MDNLTYNKIIERFVLLAKRDDNIRAQFLDQEQEREC